MLKSDILYNLFIRYSLDRVDVYCKIGPLYKQYLVSLDAVQGN